MKKTSHFTALIHYSLTENGGVVNPFSTGFRTSFQFPFELQAYLGSHNFEEPELIFPGDSVTVEITLINAESFLSKLYTGMDFEISDNSGVIGTGVISDVYDR
ncbi:hypothetical protein [Chryseobacterium sp. Leaf394]|uniref:hypothetical protein n=1 Tax=Chryseobacterium sp. Leaf394 TaxID=1736361 RepID=UPI000FF88E8D|nr:hypothetical protein [Chryseobacterium sp. Leaf394]